MAQLVQHIVIRIDDCHTMLYSSSPVALNVHVILDLCSPPCSSCSPAWQLDPIFIFSWVVTKNQGFHPIHPYCHDDHCVLAQLLFLAPRTSSKGSRVYRIWGNTVCFFCWQAEHWMSWILIENLFFSLCDISLTQNIRGFLRMVCHDPLESSLISILWHLWVSQQHTW